MVARSAQKLDAFGELIATRSLARFHAWIVTGLVILYLVTFPIFKTPLLVTVPVVVAAWFYYRRVGFLASILAFLLNLFLVNRFTEQSAWDMLLNWKSGFLIGHIFAALVSIMVGYSRRVFENLFQ